MIKNCLFCGNLFKTKPSEVKVGKGKLCSRICADKYRNKGKYIECLNCGKNKWYPSNRWKRNKSGRFFCSRLCGFQHTKNRMSLYPVNYQLRRLHQYIKWRNKIFKRDNYVCQKCYICGGQLNVDHIVPLWFIFQKNKIKTLSDAIKCKEIWETKNGLTLCEPCHKLTPTYGGRVFSYETIIYT